MCSPPALCTTTVINSTQLVNSVNQCNGIIVGGGSNLTCNVPFTNDVATGAATTAATVNQCIGSGTGGGTQPTVLCAPGGEHDKCHRHPVQRLENRRRRVFAGEVRGDRCDVCTPRDDQSMQRVFQRWREHGDLHDHVREQRHHVVVADDTHRSWNRRICRTAPPGAGGVTPGPP